MIGVSCGFTDYGDYLGVAFSRPLSRLGALPVVLPYLEDNASAQEALRRLDGLLLGVGRDLEPARYGGTDHPSLTEHSRYRDDFELGFTRLALQSGLPVLGICRGMQVINVALGGTLHPDHGTLAPPANRHPGGDWDRWSQVVAAVLSGRPAPSHPSHHIEVAPGSLLARAVGRHSTVNSYHHQSVAALGAGVVPVAWADDGVIEAIEVPGSGAFCCGVQWELQESWKDDAAQFEIFRQFVEAARRGCGERGALEQLRA